MTKDENTNKPLDWTYRDTDTIRERQTGAGREDLRITMLFAHTFMSPTKKIVSLVKRTHLSFLPALLWAGQIVG